MANPTTYFGWVMPTATDLVTDLPADFNVFGQGVDTSMSQLLGGTTGQVLSKTSATNMAFTWVTPTDQTPLTTKGDLFTFTTVDARLGIGANDTVLTADSAQATGMKWAAPAASGGMTSIASGSLSGASLSLTSISGSYKDLRLILRDYNLSVNGGFTFTANSVTSYTGARLYTGDTTGSAVVNTTDTNRDKIFCFGHTASSGDDNNAFMINIFDYTNTTNQKIVSFTNKYESSSGIQHVLFGNFGINTTSAITSLTITGDVSSFSGGTYILYGVN